MEEKFISPAVIRRLPRYYRYLGDLLNQNVERISSGDLSRKMKVTASQIRQDLNNFGGFGQQGYGYNVEYLHTEIAKILGLDKTYNAIIVGAGNLAKALANYKGFQNLGFNFVSFFDNDPLLYGKTITGIGVRPMEQLKEFARENNVEIAVLAIPKEYAADTAKLIAQSGIRAIWNFAHVDLDLPEEIFVENVHLQDSLMLLSYELHNRAEEEK